MWSKGLAAEFGRSGIQSKKRKNSQLLLDFSEEMVSKGGFGASTFFSRLLKALSYMENTGKWINLSFVATGLLLAFISYLLAQKFAVALDFEGRIPNLDLILKVSSMGLGLLCYGILFKHKVANQYMDEVFSELSKVTWPGSEETFKGTIAVVIAVLIAGFCLGLVDMAWSKVMALIL